MVHPIMKVIMLNQIQSDKFFVEFDKQFSSTFFQSRGDADLYVEKSDRQAPKVILKGASIVAIKIDKDTTKLVIFRPDASTRKIVKTFENKCIDMSIEDANGSFNPQRPKIIIGSIYEYGNDTMIVTTKDQE